MSTEDPKKSSTYTESHKRYYERYKPLINARRKKYASAYKKMWWKKNKDRVLLERALKRLEDRANKES